jgi:hypothetical protein
MRPNNSRHCLPMNSVIFRDTRVDLHWQQVRANNQTQASLCDRPQTAVTALPQPSPHLNSTALPFSTTSIVSTSGTAVPTKLVKANKNKNKESKKTAKTEKAANASAIANANANQNPPGSKKRIWGSRLFRAIKHAFPWTKKKEEEKTAVIGAPYNFEHVGTAGIYPLRSPVPPRLPVQMQQNCTPSSQHVPHGGPVLVPAQVPEDTILEQDEGEGEGEWEDMEETRIFHRE